MKAKSSSRFQCPACYRWFETEHGRNIHLSQAQSCKWFKKGKLRDLSDSDGDNSMDSRHSQSSPSDIEMGDDRLQDEEFDSDPESECSLEERQFRFLDESRLMPPSVPFGAEAGPGPSTQARFQRLAPGNLNLDEDDDERHIINHSSSGLIKARQTPTAPSLSPDDNIFAPFSSDLDWQVAQWAIKDSIGHSSFDRLLAIPGVVDKLGLSYHNIHGLHNIVDNLSERAGEWKTSILSFDDSPDEKLTIRYRCPIEAIKNLWKNPENATHMVYSPQKVYTDSSMQKRIYNELWTGKWWHILQEKVPVGATIAPVIIATDKTQLTQFSGNKSAYPVYLTIGNLPKAIRRKPSKNACILLGYLPVEKLDRSKMTTQEHRSRIQRIFHHSMKIILQPLIKAGVTGVDMESSNGDVRQVHPILTCYVADYPEQCLVACSKYGTCPKCQCSASHLQDYPSSSSSRTAAWTLRIIQDAQKEARGSSAVFHRKCMEHDVAGGVYEPFWKDFPYTDIHKAITPDILHQLYQGVFKHLVEWCQTIIGEKILDQRIRALPRGFGLQHFKNGISALSQISGSERKNMAKILLGCIHDLLPVKGVNAIRGLLDFIYLAQYPTHDDDTLSYLTDALHLFHQYKDYFITDVGVRKHLNLPKLHSLVHYDESIRLFGTTDNFNTEMFERLHIDFAKHGWRATNQRDEFPQMVAWLSRREKILSLHQDISVRRQQLSPPQETHIQVQPTQRLPLLIAKRPQLPNFPVSEIENRHKAPQFTFHLKQFLNSLHSTPLSRNVTINAQALPFTSLDIFTNFRFPLASLQDEEEDLNSVKALPISPTHPSGQFDTVVYISNVEGQATSMIGTTVARIKVIFTLPTEIKRPGHLISAPEIWPKDPLAYVETYRISQTANKHHGMYKVSQEKDNQGRLKGAIIPLTNIRQSCMLIPIFPDPDSPTAHSLRSWNTHNALDQGTSFVLNNFLNMYSYQTIY